MWGNHQVVAVGKSSKEKLALQSSTAFNMEKEMGSDRTPSATSSKEI